MIYLDRYIDPKCYPNLIQKLFQRFRCELKCRDLRFKRIRLRIFRKHPALPQDQRAKGWLPECNLAARMQNNLMSLVWLAFRVIEDRERLWCVVWLALLTSRFDAIFAFEDLEDDFI